MGNRVVCFGTNTTPWLSFFILCSLQSSRLVVVKCRAFDSQHTCICSKLCASDIQVVSETPQWTPRGGDPLSVSLNDNAEWLSTIMVPTANADSFNPNLIRIKAT